LVILFNYYEKKNKSGIIRYLRWY